MNKLLLALAISILSMSAYSGDVIVWNGETRTLHIPSIISPEGTQLYSSAKLIKGEDGLFELTDLVPYEAPDICTGTPSGIESFNAVFSRRIYINDIHRTEAGNLVIITGMSRSSIDRGQYAPTESYTCYSSPETLPEPEPENGKKGAYYCLFDGEVAFLDHL